MLKNRVVIIDFNHLAYQYMFTGGYSLSVPVVENGVTVNKDTRIQSGTIKRIYKWSQNGTLPTSVCFDRPVTVRKEYFEENFADMKIGGEAEYKGGRSKMPDTMYTAISDVEYILRKGGVSVFSENQYEADDLIFACVQRAKVKYPGYKIDVITNDADLLPLVDDTVSVFIRSKKGTWAESSELEKSKYVQVTPDNYEEYIEGLSAFQGFRVPYNTVLLYKLLRGDVSDNYRRKDISKMFPPKKYNALIDRLIEDNVNISEIFRYGEPTMEIRYKASDEVYEGTLEEAKQSDVRHLLYQKIMNPYELDAILKVLRKYTDMSDSMLSHIEKMYWGINLNQIYVNKKHGSVRREFECEKHGDIHTFSEIELQKACNPLQIRLLR